MLPVAPPLVVQQVVAQPAEVLGQEPGQARAPLVVLEQQVLVPPELVPQGVQPQALPLLEQAPQPRALQQLVDWVLQLV